MDNSMESEKLTPDVNSKKLRPGRMCIFCNKVIHGGKIKRHILTHKTSHEEVANILKKSSVEQNKWFERKRIEGMYDYNTKFNTDGGDTYMRQRKPKKTDNIRMCVNCKKFISNRTFYKHKTKCGESSEPIKPLLLKPSVIHKDSEFVSTILNKFRDGEVGSLIRQDKTIQIIGYKHFLCRKSECSKTNAIRKEVMMEMREIARLYLCFKELCEDVVTVEDMFTRKKLPELKESIKGLCQSDNGEKHGLKLNLTGIFQRCIKILIGYYAESCQDLKQKEIKRFQAAFNFSLAEIIGKSRNQANKNSLKKARLPKNLPEADDMAKLGIFIKSEIEHCVKNFTSHEYTWLRSLVVARITLYNAHRGEEGSRLLVEEWQDAMNQVWVPPEIIDSIEDDAERFLAGQFRLAYMSGKGKKYVPLLIPVDLIEAVEILLSHRKQFGISEDNIFLFATKSSCAHCSGWHAVSSVCAAAGVLVNATKNRHRASTVYAALDMNESDRRIFFDHLGHEETINKENYQCPPGLQEIRVMGKFLNTLEGGSCETEQTRLPQKGCDQESTSKAESEGCSTDNEQNACTPKKRKKKLVSFRWSQDMTARVMKDFQCWIERDRGNPLPSKKELEKYLKKNDVRCTLFQLRTKIMNEQNKRRNSISKKISMFQN